MKSRRETLKLFGGAGLGLTFAPLVCAQDSVGNPDQSAASLIRAARDAARKFSGQLTILLPRGSDANVKPVTDAFSAATGVSFKFVFSDVDSVNTTIMADRITGRNSWDIALPATFGLPDLVEAGALAPLNALEKKYADVTGSAKSLYPVGDSYLGQTYGYQTDGDVYVMFYRKSWLEDPSEQARFRAETGETLKIPETWDQLDRAMKHFHRPDEGKYGGALFRNPNYLVWEFWLRLHTNKSWPVDEKFGALINQEAGVQALDAMVSAGSSLYPAASVDGLFANWKAFAAGNIFCNIGWGGSQKFFNSAASKIRGDLVFAPTPGGKHKDKYLSIPYFNWGWNYTVSSTTPARDLSYLFARFAVTPDISARAIRARDGFFDPFLSAHYSDPEIQAAYSPEFLSVHRDSMRGSIPDFYVRGKEEYFDILRESLVAAISGKLTVRQALDFAAARWNQITFRLGQQNQMKQWQYLQQKYPAEIRGFLDA